jgi:iron complex outermembrane receptor protein
MPGQGFETPTFAELAYRPGGATGLNFALRPATSRSAEVGAKGSLAKGMRFSLAAFRVETRDEIVVNSNVGGRSDFKNASRTQRDGFEASLEGRAAGFDYALAYTWLDARFTEPFTSGTPPGRRSVGIEAARRPGKRLPRRGRLAPRAKRLPCGRRGALGRKVYVNEQNTDAAPRTRSSTCARDSSSAWARGGSRNSCAVDNVSDRRYSGSVIVSEARGRFFEPAPGPQRPDGNHRDLHVLGAP